MKSQKAAAARRADMRYDFEDVPTAREMGTLMAVKFGDHVNVFVQGNGVAGHDGYVIGWPPYSKGLGDVVLIATEQYVGAPYHVDWCTADGASDPTLARTLGDRYLERFPGALKRPTSVEPRDVLKGASERASWKITEVPGDKVPFKIERYDVSGAWASTTWEYSLDDARAYAEAEAHDRKLGAVAWSDAR